MADSTNNSIHLIIRRRVTANTHTHTFPSRIDGQATSVPMAGARAHRNRRDYGHAAINCSSCDDHILDTLVMMAGKRYALRDAINTNAASRSLFYVAVAVTHSLEW